MEGRNDFTGTNSKDFVINSIQIIKDSKRIRIYEESYHSAVTELPSFDSPVEL